MSTFCCCLLQHYPQHYPQHFVPVSQTSRQPCVVLWWKARTFDLNARPIIPSCALQHHRNRSNLCYLRSLTPSTPGRTIAHHSLLLQKTPGFFFHFLYPFLFLASSSLFSSLQNDRLRLHCYDTCRLYEICAKISPRVCLIRRQNFGFTCVETWRSAKPPYAPAVCHFWPRTRRRQRSVLSYLSQLESFLYKQLFPTQKPRQDTSQCLSRKPTP